MDIRVVALLFAVVTVWLALPGRYALDAVAAIAVLLHIAVGAVLLPPALRWCSRWRGTVRGVGERRAWKVASLLLIACAATGLWMAARALLGQPADRPAWVGWAHSGTGTAAALLAVVLVARGRWLSPGSARASWIGPLAAAGIVAAVAVSLAAGLRPGSRAPGYDADAYYRLLTATAAVQAGNPLFPAALRTSGAGGGGDAECRRCHTREAEEWQHSAHARAGVETSYLRSLADFAARRGAAASRWCEGCHAPERLLATTHDDRERAKDQGPGTKDSLRLHLRPSPFALRIRDSALHTPHSESVSCLSCHAVSRVSLLTGNGGVERDRDVSLPWPGARGAAAQRFAEFLLYLRPRAHRAAVSRATRPQAEEAPHFAAARLCSACHRLGMSVAQNGYRFLRGPDEYGSWLDSAVSGNSIRGFRAPGRPRSCQSCHMPRDGGHRFPAASADAAITVDLFAARAGPAGGGAGEEWAAPLDDHPGFLRPGRPVTVDVVVANRGVGHTFPAGFSHLRDVWLQVTLEDASGRPLLAHGLPDARGRLAPDTHRFGLLPLDRRGRLLRHNELDEWVALAREPAGIAPGEAHVARYRLELPRETRGPLTLRARLLDRRYTPEFAAFLAENGRSGVRAFRRSGARAAVRIVAEDAVPLSIPAAASPRRQARTPYTQGPTPNPLAGRWFDYGIALLLQDDLPRAARAMQQAQEASLPGADAWLGLGRVYLREGDLLAARSQFEEAARRAPDDARPRAFLGILYRRMGEYDRALALLEPLTHRYPADRSVWFDIGIAHLRAGRPAEAAEAFTRMLALDPDDVAAHYNLWMCYQRLRRFADARREEAVYRYLRPDDGANPALARYLRAHPAAAEEALPIHVHRLRSIVKR